MDYGTPGFPVVPHLLEFAQTHVHSVNDASNHLILWTPSPPSCPQSFPASGSFPMMLVASGDQRIRASVSVLPMTIQDWLVWSPCCPRDSQVFSSTTIQKHQFFGAQSSLWSHICTWLLAKPYVWLHRPFYQGVTTPGKDQTTETCVPGQRMNQGLLASRMSHIAQ